VTQGEYAVLPRPAVAELPGFRVEHKWSLVASALHRHKALAFVPAASRTASQEEQSKNFHAKSSDWTYDNCMKRPPDNPEFARFTRAMRHIMGVSKTELQRRMEEEKKGKQPKASASPSVASASMQER